MNVRGHIVTHLCHHRHSSCSSSTTVSDQKVHTTRQHDMNRKKKTELLLGKHFGNGNNFSCGLSIEITPFTHNGLSAHVFLHNKYDNLKLVGAG